MSWVDGALGDFGRSLGVPDLRFPDSGAVTMQFERTGSLNFEKIDDAVLVYLVRSLDRPDADVFERALDACHWRHNHPYPVQAGLGGDTRLSFSVRIPDAEFQLPTIERIVDFLKQMHESCSDGALA